MSGSDSLPPQMPSIQVSSSASQASLDESAKVIARPWEKQISEDGSCSNWSFFTAKESFFRRDGEAPKEPQIFVNTELMKEKVRQNLTRPKYDVQKLYKSEGCSQAIAKNQRFEYVTLIVIAVNAIWIMIDTDFNDAELLLEAEPIFQIMENLFCSFFTFELSVRLLSFMNKVDAFKDLWFCFDSVLVLMMVLETWVMTAVIAFSGTGSTSGMGNASILRIARLLRLSRMTRMARLLRAMPEMMILIKGMISATRSVFFTFVLLIIVTYIFAITFSQLTVGTDVEEIYFSSVPHSMYTLLIHGALIDDISAFAKKLSEGMPQQMGFLVAAFFAYVLLAALTIMNMLIGVLCEVVSAVAATEKESMMVKYVHTKLRTVMQLLDADGDDQISKTEFLKILENTDAVRALQDVGVDAIGLVDFADFIFEDDGIGRRNSNPNKQLTFAHFMDTVLQLRGTNTATVKDMVDVRKFLRIALEQISTEIEDLRQCIIAYEKEPRRPARKTKRLVSEPPNRPLSCISRSEHVVPAPECNGPPPLLPLVSSPVGLLMIDEDIDVDCKKGLHQWTSVKLGASSGVAAEDLADTDIIPKCDVSSCRKLATTASVDGHPFDHGDTGKLTGEWCSLPTVISHPTNNDGVKPDMTDACPIVGHHTVFGTSEHLVGPSRALGTHAESLSSEELQQVHVLMAHFERVLKTCLFEYEKVHQSINLKLAKHNPLPSML